MRRFKLVPTIYMYLLSKNKKNIFLFSSENNRFYSREKVLLITWACFRNEKAMLLGRSIFCFSVFLENWTHSAHCFSILLPNSYRFDSESA